MLRKFRGVFCQVIIENDKISVCFNIVSVIFFYFIISVGDAPRFPYSRPEFLYLTSDDEIFVSGDQTTRPILVPKDPQKMVMFAGYAETINAGKTEKNEDQAVCRLLNLTSKNQTTSAGAKSAPTRRKKLSMEPVAQPAAATTSLVRSHSDEDLLSEITPAFATNVISDKKFSTVLRKLSKVL